MPTRICASCGSTDTSLVVGLCLDWPNLRKATIDCADVCEACGLKSGRQFQAGLLTTAVAPDLIELHRLLARGDLVAADRCTTRIMRAIARQLPQLAPEPA